MSGKLETSSVMLQDSSREFAIKDQVISENHQDIRCSFQDSNRVLPNADQACYCSSS